MENIPGKRIERRRLLVLLTCLLHFGAASGQSLPAKINEYIENRGKGSEFSGVILIARHGKIILSKGYGMADYEFSIPNTPPVRFRIASLTKPFTAIGVMKLQEQGKLTLEAPISSYLKDCPTEWSNITIYHLLTHTSGLPDLFGEMKAVPVEQTAGEFERVVAGAKNKPLKNRPGEAFEYSNFGYCVLGYIIEKASGDLYATFLDKNIVRPLRMTGTLYDDPRPIIKNRASGYIRRDGQLVNDKLSDPAGYSAGGILSTAGDLLLLDRALYSSELLSKESLDQMFTAFKNDYGYGWKVTTQFDRKVFNHTGGTHGFSSHIARYPDEKLLIVVLSNIENENPQGLACNIAGMMLGTDKADLIKPVRLTEETLKKYAGEYAFSPENVRAIQVDGTSLFFQINNDRYKLVPLGNDLFFLENQDQTRFRFITNEGGQVTGLVRTTCGKEDLRGKRR